MSEDNTVQQVASGTAPQPYVKQEPNYDQTQSEAEDAVDSGLEASESAEDQIDAAAADGKISKTEAQQLKKTLKIKVDGKDLEETIDFNDDEALKRYIQKSKAFDKRNNEFVSYKAQVDKLMEMLEKDPESVMEKLGHNMDDMSEKRLSRKIEEMKKSPEQVEREKMEKELNELKKEKKLIQEEKEKAQMEQMRNETAQQIENEIADALGSTKSILPTKNPVVLQRIAQTMLMAMNNGYPQVTAKDVIPLVEKQWQQELNEFFSVTPEETLERLVGKANLDRYRKKKVAASSPKGQTTTAKQIGRDTGTPKKAEDAEYKPKSAAKFRKFFSYE